MISIVVAFPKCDDMLSPWLLGSKVWGWRTTPAVWCLFHPACCFSQHCVAVKEEVSRSLNRTDSKSRRVKEKNRWKTQKWTGKDNTPRSHSDCGERKQLYALSLILFNDWESVMHKSPTLSKLHWRQS